MRRTAHTLTVAVVLLYGVATTLTASADTIFSSSFTGTFTQDDQILQLTVNIQSALPVRLTLTTLSYAGGVNLQGATIPAGGFDPVLALFNSSDVLLAINDDNPNAPCDPGGTHQCFDAQLIESLTPGSYFVTLMQFDNVPIAGIGQPFAGFTEAGKGNFTGPTFCNTTGSFLDSDCNQRTGNWALDVSATSSTSAVPEPSMLILFSSGLAGLLARMYGLKRH